LKHRQQFVPVRTAMSVTYKSRPAAV